MRVVLDSNVLVAAFATHGVCSELFEHCLKNTTILCSDFIAVEVERILVDKIKIPTRKSSEIIRYIRNQAQWIIPESIIIGNLRDPNDQMIVATALSGKADFLITGDKDMLVLKKIKGTIMISPRDYWIRCQES